MRCEFLGIDIQDDMGRHEVGFVENTVKTPIGLNQEGCLFEARFQINKVINATLIWAVSNNSTSIKDKNNRDYILVLF